MCLRDMGTVSRFGTLVVLDITLQNNPFMTLYKMFSFIGTRLQITKCYTKKFRKNLNTCLYYL